MKKIVPKNRRIANIHTADFVPFMSEGKEDGTILQLNTVSDAYLFINGQRALSTFWTTVVALRSFFFYYMNETFRSDVCLELNVPWQGHICRCRVRQIKLFYDFA